VLFIHHTNHTPYVSYTILIPCIAYGINIWVCLQFNPIGDAGAAEVARALKTNRTLQTISLSAAGIGAAGATALASAIKQNSTLTSLDLASNNLGAGAVAMAQALAGNSALAVLLIGDCHIDEEGGAALSEVLASNQALTTVDVFGNDAIAPETVAAISSAATRNRKALTA
jgi:Ran GTPase-activating protein (RanGAP) involved in mRNA processing and transport